MATLTTLPIASTPPRAGQIFAADALFVSASSALALLLLGYHPYAEDGGIYASAVALRINPALFPAERAFAIGQTGLTLFVPLVAGLAKVLDFPLSLAILLLHVIAIVATLATARQLARVLFSTRAAQNWSVLTLAVSLGLPVAGTSLYLCDPYLTARSLATPLLLLATTALLRRQHAWMAAGLLLAATLHPLMAVWTSLLLLLFHALQTSRPALLTSCITLCVLVAMGLAHALSPGEAQPILAASLSRKYWFLREWEAWEIVGLLAPLLLLGALGLGRIPRAHSSATPQAKGLALAGAIAIATVGAGSVLFIHTTDASHFLARLQPLRLLHPVYLLLLMLLGGCLFPALPRRVAWGLSASAAIALVGMQWCTYPSSNYFELPGKASGNPWVRAFEWSARHTPVDAVFALDAHYTTLPGEDAQLFRAIAQRSQLPDAAKDGGISSVMTDLASHWKQASDAQTGLDQATDVERLTRLRRLGASWIVLSSTSRTAFWCPYRNEAAKVCRLRQN